jgi:hypothetical protein
MAFDAFISYSSKDKTAADAACAVLEGAGVRCWIAPRDIRPGREYGAAIVDAIDQCRVMVLIFSSSANDSGQVHREIERAVTRGVPIVPVRIEEVAPTKSLAYFLGAIHWLDALTPPIEKYLQKLAETVKAILQVNVSAGSAAVDDGANKISALSHGLAADGSQPRYGPARIPAGADRLISRNSARSSWLLPALGGGTFVVLLAAGVWLYQSRVHNPTAMPSATSSQPAPTPTDRLGRVWQDEESGWSGVWSRRGVSSIFDANWTHPSGGKVAATLDVALDGNQITIARTDTGGNPCAYQGILAAGGSVSGTYGCYGGFNATSAWQAKIDRGAAADWLGRLWQEAESGWTGVWSRRGNSSIFDANWIHPDGRKVAATLFMVLSANKMIINRTDINGGHCIYQGTMAADFGSVSGTYSCFGTSNLWIWRATIGN